MYTRVPALVHFLAVLVLPGSSTDHMDLPVIVSALQCQVKLSDKQVEEKNTARLFSFFFFLFFIRARTVASEFMSVNVCAAAASQPPRPATSQRTRMAADVCGWQACAETLHLIHSFLMQLVPPK
ncbi:hypothetical protein B0T19DRAFT_80136 [Cercophora scortea]|uniref:Secreted protein n=1 Tax=Cercophora scortea TaxID=314031 RepID=A0AAE0MM37_9PEZI|nr:hypothetical protein B0T19DRAFT_80136 [Cercophora scortea]